MPKLKCQIESKAQMSNINNSKFDELVKSLKIPLSVIPAQAGIQLFQIIRNSLDSGSHRSDDFLRNYQF